MLIHLEMLELVMRTKELEADEESVGEVIYKGRAGQHEVLSEE